MHIQSLSPPQFGAAVALWHDAGLTWLAGRGVPKIDLMVRTENDGVIAFYAALGYGHDDVVVMSKRLR